MWAPASPGDVPAITALQARHDTFWFGAPEQDEREVGQALALAAPLAERSRVARAGDGTVVAAAWWITARDSVLVVDPGHGQRRRLLADAVRWFEDGGVTAVESLDRDTVLAEVLARRGWVLHHCSYELLRTVREDWRLDPPRWPPTVRVTGMGAQDPATVHELVYRRARWADVPGHGERELEQWRQAFVDEHPPQQQVLAWDGDLLVGAALGRTFSDGTGWVAQLAVDQARRREGLGRALLLEALGRRVSAGATQLGLGVSAANPQALSLYLDVGLRVDREWRTFHRSTG